jgi:hypothetical protein
MTKRPDSWEDPPEDPPEDDTTVPLPEPDYEDLEELNWVPANHAPYRNGEIQDRDCDYWNNLDRNVSRNRTFSPERDHQDSLRKPR